MPLADQRWSGKTPNRGFSIRPAALRRPCLIAASAGASRIAAVIALVPGVFLGGCQSVSSSKSAPAASPPILAADALVPSPRLIIGRIIAINPAQGFAFIELAPDAPNAALIAGTEWIARTLELRETGRMHVSPYVRGRTVGTKIVAGQPSTGDEVVWLAP
jgi:hypothetical protein